MTLTMMRCNSTLISVYQTTLIYKRLDTTLTKISKPVECSLLNTSMPGLLSLKTPMSKYPILPVLEAMAPYLKPLILTRRIYQSDSNRSWTTINRDRSLSRSSVKICWKIRKVSAITHPTKLFRPLIMDSDQLRRILCFRTKMSYFLKLQDLDLRVLGSINRWVENKI